ncbi:methionyl-tRNA formyltransferase [Lachnospiraceae bacterium 45-P1]
MKTILIGSVTSSQTMLESMIDVKFPISFVFSLDDKHMQNVSGYQPLHELAKSKGIPYKKFVKINDQENIDIIKNIDPDYIFIIGLSQLVKKEIIDIAKIGVVGFHPTALPKMRGRAANVWQVLLGIHKTKCSLFLIDEGIDSGDILGQEEYVIEDTDYAEDVRRKLNLALETLSKRVLKQIMDGTLLPVKQNEAEATYLLKRSQEDGEINWNQPIKDIHRLIRAVSKPYPGAFGMYDGKHKIIIWRAEIRENKKYIGINGQIAKIGESCIDVVCTDGLLHITEYENVDDVKIFVGHKLKMTGQ